MFSKKNVLLEGDKNAGGTNAFYIRRSYKNYFLIAISDVGKAFIAALIAYHFLNNLWLATLLSGVFSTIGHNYSLFLRFKGGKGASTNAGTFLFINPLIAVFFAVSILVLHKSNQLFKYTDNEFIETIIRIVVVVLFVLFFFQRFTFHAVLFQLVSVIKYVTEKQAYKELKFSNN